MFVCLFVCFFVIELSVQEILLTFVMHNYSICFSLFLSVMIIYKEDNRVLASLECVVFSVLWYSAF